MACEKVTSAEETGREENKGDGELGKGRSSGRIKRAGPVRPHPEKDTVPRQSPFYFPDHVYSTSFWLRQLRRQLVSSSK